MLSRLRRRVRPRNLKAAKRARELALALEAARQAQERADRQSRTKTAYLRTVGHEIATPLASLREGVQRLREVCPLAAVPAAAGHAASFQAIEASLEWIAELGQAIRDYARGDPCRRASGTLPG
jgi:signal transduction histidine kinase